MRGFRQEQGITLISLAFILLMIAFFTLLVLKIAPIYMNHSKVLNALAAVEETTDITSKSKREIMVTLNKRFNLNYVDHINNDNVKITKGENYLKVAITYEVIESIMGNLSVLIEFDDFFEVDNS
jgi:hypothetical protein